MPEPRHRSLPLAALAAWWVVAFALVAFSPPWQLAGTARRAIDGVLVVLVSIGLAVLLRPAVPDRWRRRIGWASAIAAPAITVYACEAGGIRSLAHVAAALATLGTITALGARATWIATAALVCTSTAAVAIRGDVLPGEDIAYAVVIACSVTVLPSLYIRRSTARQAVRTLAELPSFGTPPSLPAVREATGQGTRSGATGVREDDGVRSHADTLGRYLRQVKDTLGAEDAIYWRAPIPGGTLVPAAWATGEARRLRDDLRLGRDLVPVLQARRVALFDRGGDGTMAAVAVPGAAGAIGVVTVHGPSADVESPVLSAWLPRFAEQLGILDQLLETQAEYSRQTRQSSAVLDASQAFQKHRDEESLGQVVVDSALKVTGGTRAALVRWLDQEDTGTITHLTEEHHLVRGAAIDRDSHVARLCRAGLPQVWEDARAVEDEAPVYARLRPVATVGSLAVIPLRVGTRTTGAIVVEGDRVGDVLVREVRNLRLLAQLAAESLETVRHIAEATRRAQTDHLTGLMNRGAFDEALRRAIAEADRYGRTVGLIVCDVDHFKRVNDVYGHDAGDEVLKAVAGSLTAGVRDVDVVARYGGEELVVLLVQSDLAATWEVADRLRAAIEAKTITVGERLLRVTASFGVAAYPETARLGDELFGQADKALYQAKREGRNCVRFARPLQPPRVDPPPPEEREPWREQGWTPPDDAPGIG